LINKFDGLLFTKNDENFVEAFAIFCGMGIHNTHMYEKAITAMAKQSVTLDTLRIPSSVHYCLHELAFDDIEMTDDDTLRACLRMRRSGGRYSASWSVWRSSSAACATTSTTGGPITPFKSISTDRVVTPLWGECEERRGLLRAMLMTACDLAAITKPWPVERRVAALVAGEFFRQGDLERQNLNLTPIDIMNRDKEDELPAMQVKFIDSICLPIYEPMLDRVKSNRAHWIELSNNDNYDKENLPDRNDKSSTSSHVDDTENTYEGDSSGPVSLSSETNSKYENLENPVVGLLTNNALAMLPPNKFDVND
ncbi:putative dual 3',5'-cyclic-AMP and-GMP phosphodiesterase, partial [Operophtera brumata]